MLYVSCLSSLLCVQEVAVVLVVVVVKVVVWLVLVCFGPPIHELPHRDRCDETLLCCLVVMM